jgi:hypothetical protein
LDDLSIKKNKKAGADEVEVLWGEKENWAIPGEGTPF